MIPSLYEFRAVYRAGQPESLARWRTLEAEASLIVNANFFDENHRALGLVISDGSASGSSYRDRGGTFLVRNGLPEIITHRSQKRLNIQGIEQAVQGFPLLVEDGEQAYYTADGSGERTRRTMIGIDKRGQFLIMVAPFLGLSLADLSAYLPKTDLDLDAAFNLDGGGSTMIALPGADYFSRRWMRCRPYSQFIGAQATDIDELVYTVRAISANLPQSSGMKEG